MEFEEIVALLLAGVLIGLVCTLTVISNFGIHAEWSDLQTECELIIPRNQKCVAKFIPKSTQ